MKTMVITQDGATASLGEITIDGEKHYSITRFANLADKWPSYISRQCKEGYLKYKTIETKKYIPASELENYIGETK